IFSFEQVFDEGDGIPENPVPEEGGQVAFLYVAAGLLIGAAIVFGIWSMVKGRGRSKETEEKEGKEKAETKKTAAAVIPKKPQSPSPKPGIPASLTLNPEQKEILAFLRKEGGRATQKEIRKALPYSEAKISTDLAILEDAGVVKKIKKGRGNVVRMA
ncbi:MAG: ArsR family transcriptional regulator, partial [Candidatus Micrarchaeota archaeon]